jgi:SAM-dependent methyltransferase
MDRRRHLGSGSRGPRHISGGVRALASQSIAVFDNAGRPNSAPAPAGTDGPGSRGRLRPGLFPSSDRAEPLRRTSHSFRRARTHVGDGGAAPNGRRARQLYSSLGPSDKLPFPDAAFDVVFMITVLGEVPDRATAVKEAARVLRPGARFSSTEAAGDPDRVSRAELDELAGLAGLAKAESWSGLLVQTFNYSKPAGSILATKR